MSNLTEITSLAEIRERKAEVRRELDRSKKAAANQLAATAGDAKTYVLRDVVLPAAGVALGVYVLTKVVKSITRSNSQEDRQEYVTADHQEDETTGPAATVQRTRSMASPAQKISRAPRAQPAVSKPASFQLASLISFGQLLVPAGKAILNIIKDNSK